MLDLIVIAKFKTELDAGVVRVVDRRRGAGRLSFSSFPSFILFSLLYRTDFTQERSLRRIRLHSEQNDWTTINDAV